MKQAAYSNPFWQGNFPDPFLLKVRGRYYAYATEFETFPQKGALVFPILTSSDMVLWHSVGKAMPALGQSYGRYWAPEVTEYNDSFLLYYAVHTSEFEGGIRVALADRPEGPFIDSGHDLTHHLFPWAIDPHVFRDVDGQWYLYMTIEYWNDLNGLTGSGNVVDRLVDPFTLAGQPTRVTPPSQSWQLFEAKRAARSGVDWYTVEGPAVIKHRDRYYEFFSGGCYYRNNYAISYATSETPMGAGGMRDTSWRDSEGKEGSILLVQGDGKTVISPGHNSLVLGPNNADLYLAYHALQQDMAERRPFLDRLFWHGEQPWTPAPTFTPQPLPPQPRFRDLFTQAALRPEWKPCAGDWSVSQEEVVQQDKAAPQASLKYRGELSLAWLLEVNLRRLEGDGSYGVLLEGEDGIEQRVQITPDLHLTLWSGASPTEPIHSVCLPDNVLATAWHQLIISQSGLVLRVQFDYLHPLEVVLAHPVRRFALLTEHCRAAFTAIALTDHFMDEFLEDAHTPEMLGWHEEHTWESNGREQGSVSQVDWRVRAGALEQASAARGKHSVLKGPWLERYEFGATLRAIEEHGQAALGLLVWQSKEEKLFIWLKQHQARWILAVDGKLRSMDTAHAEFELAASFDASTWHTLRLVRSHDELTGFLDGREMFILSVPDAAERVGFATRNAAAAFTSVWLTGFPHEEEPTS